MIKDKVITKVKDHWELNCDPQFVRYVANYIYYAPDKDFYIRITDKQHRSQKQIESELHWMDYLKKCEINFAHPVRSVDGNLLESIDQYIISVFVAAPGRLLRKKEDFTKQVFYKWGNVLGQLHHHTKNYNTPALIESRAEWINEEYHLDIHENITRADGPIFDEFQRIENLFKKLLKERDSYGMIHADFHSGNFHYDENGTITLFDFDDCVYHWFSYDIAIIFWSIEQHDLDWQESEASFFEGYSKENLLEEKWLKLLPEFYRYRMILIHAFCKKGLASQKLDAQALEWMNKTIIKTQKFFDLKSECPFFKSL